MKTVGIVAEYDPFHNGHWYQLNEAKKRTGADCAVVILSGEFLQRGMPCMFDKEARTRMALEGGADLVIQLPHIYACSSGMEYAAGAAAILRGLECVDFLCFGSESTDLRKLGQAASIHPEDPETGERIRLYLERGCSYGEAVTEAVGDLAGREVSGLLRSPNNLLAVEYIRALERAGSSIIPVAVRRTPYVPAANTDGTEIQRSSGYRSAGDIRRALQAGVRTGISDAVPASTYEILKDLREEQRENGSGTVNGEPASAGSVNSYGGRYRRMEDSLLRLLLYRIRMMDRQELAEIYTVSEGLENRIIRAASAGPSTFAELVESVQTRRYTGARVRRMLIHVLTGLKTSTAESLKGTNYARILGFSSAGRKLLRAADETASIPLLSNLRRPDRLDERIRRCLLLDQRAADLYTMIRGRWDLVGREKERTPVYPSDNR